VAPPQPGRSRPAGESPTPESSLATPRRTRSPGACRSAPPGAPPTGEQLARIVTRRPPRRSDAGSWSFLRRSSCCPPLTAKFAAPRAAGFGLPPSSAPYHIIILLVQVALGYAIVDAMDKPRAQNEASDAVRLAMAVSRLRSRIRIESGLR